MPGGHLKGPEAGTRHKDYEGVWTIPNLLTFLRIALIPFFVVSSLAGHFTLALVLFVSAAATDALDGFIARKLDQRSRIGALLDPAADKTMMFCGYVVYTINGIALHRLPSWLTFTVFARDFLLVFFAYLLYTRVRVRGFPPSIPGKISTVLQVVALSVAIASNTMLAPLVVPMQVPVYALALAFTLYSGWGYLRRTDAMLLTLAERARPSASLH
ncbi:MAG: CDP-alcohol phosphatidyltransferase family protein [Acidobacteriota bacterium]